LADGVVLQSALLANGFQPRFVAIPGEGFAVEVDAFEGAAFLIVQTVATGQAADCQLSPICSFQCLEFYDTDNSTLKNSKRETYFYNATH